MKILHALPAFFAIPSVICLASFSVSDITELDDLKKRGFDLRFTFTEPSSTIERNIPYYRFTLVAPTDKSGATLNRIDFWKDKRSTEIPIQMHAKGEGKKQAFFSISENDLETSVIVVRYGFQNTSAETGYRMHLKDLIDGNKAEKATTIPPGEPRKF